MGGVSGTVQAVSAILYGWHQGHCIDGISRIVWVESVVLYGQSQWYSMGGVRDTVQMESAVLYGWSQPYRMVESVWTDELTTTMAEYISPHYLDILL